MKVYQTYFCKRSAFYGSMFLIDANLLSPNELHVAEWWKSHVSLHFPFYLFWYITDFLGLDHLTHYKRWAVSLKTNKAEKCKAVEARKWMLRHWMDTCEWGPGIWDSGPAPIVPSVAQGYSVGPPMTKWSDPLLSLLDYQQRRLELHSVWVL